MSYYYSYYLGYKHEGKIFPLGPYNAFGKLHSVVTRSRGFASDLHESFYDVGEDLVSDELRKEFEYTDWNGEKRVDLRYLPLKELPSGSFIKTGYFLIDDVKRYEEYHGTDGIFFEHLSPTVYAAMAQHEAQFGKPGPKKDDFDEEYQPYSASDYMFYAYPDYHSKEYEALLISEAAEELSGYQEMPEGAELVVIDSEG